MIKKFSNLYMIYPTENMIYQQIGENPGTIIFPTNYTPKKMCKFVVQSSEGGIYIMNNSNIEYNGNLFIYPNKMCNFNLFFDDEKKKWKLGCNQGTLQNNSLIIEWTKLFNTKVIGAPPLAARKYAIFINGIYNTILNYTDKFEEAVANTSAYILYEKINNNNDSLELYNKYPKLNENEYKEIQNFLSSYQDENQIPTSSLDNSYILPDINITKWYGTNPILPNWNSSNISYLSNTFTTIPEEPFSDMSKDSKELIAINRTKLTEQVAYHFAKISPPAHMINIICSMISNKDLTTLSSTKLLSLLSIALSDAGIYAWTVKYHYWGTRPFQYITNFNPQLTTPNFPGYISGHSTFSGAWEQILSMLIPSHKQIFKYISELSGISRIYGGIHFMKDNIIGLDSGRKIGENIYMNLLDKIKNNLALI